jgi:transposase
MAGKRRHHTPEFKAKIVLEVLKGEKTSSEICRTHKLNVNLLNRWRQELLEKAPTIFEQVDLRSEDQQRIAELERLVGQLTMQLEIAKKASSYWEPEKNGRS